MRTTALLASALFAFAAPASAAVIGGAVTDGVGSFVELDGNSSFTVGKNTFDDDNLYAFNEDQDFALTADLAVDLGLGTIAAGTRVSSHFVFFDALRFSSQVGYVDFDGEILGVATSKNTLNDTDALISNSITYLTPGARGLESSDNVEIDTANANRILLDWKSGTPGDYIRVFTAAGPSISVVPVPAGGMLLLTGLVGLGGMRMRKKHG